MSATAELRPHSYELPASDKSHFGPDPKGEYLAIPTGPDGVVYRHIGHASEKELSRNSGRFRMIADVTAPVPSFFADSYTPPSFDPKIMNAPLT